MIIMKKYGYFNPDPYSMHSQIVKFINNQKALAQITQPSHIPTETEFGTE